MCVLEQDGSFKSAAFNAVSLALMNAGIAMKDYLVATTSGLMGNVAVLDLIYQEEKRQNCEFVIVHYAKSKKIAYISLNCNKIKIQDFQNLLQMSQSSCDQISEIMRNAVQEKLLSNFSCFYFKWSDLIIIKVQICW